MLSGCRLRDPRGEGTADRLLEALSHRGLPGGRPGVRRKTPARTFQGPLNPPARGRYGILLSRSATRLSPRDVVERERIVMVEPRRTGMSMSSPGSHATPRWREVDSNLRSPVSGDTPQRPLITSPSSAG